LKVRQRSVQQLDGKETTVGAAPLEREARARLDGDLSMANGIRIFQAERPTFIEISVVDGVCARGGDEQEQQRNGQDLHHR
jgi:hypothetical protein